ncbi:rCG55276 [Rattus norvegicus]|uniref:RCG55276 n=1 Tax=Rattus norvegicus TaxID=10116 RepID=A6J7Z0_RAT|nr:rCG55276 [Rattus norvegicus]
MASNIFCCCYKASDSTSNSASHLSTRVAQQNHPLWGRCFITPDRRTGMNRNAPQRGIQRRHSFNLSNNWIKLCSLRRP